MKRISFALVLAALTAGCQTSPELASKEQALDDCLPDGNYCGTIGQPLPAKKWWKAGDPLGYLSPGSVVIVQSDGQGHWIAYGVDVPGQQVKWLRIMESNQLGPFGDVLDLAGLGMWLRPPPPPPPPPGQEVLYLLEEAFRIGEAPDNARESAMACEPPMP